MLPAFERLIGRERELELLESFVAGASSEGGALLVTGDAGVGKTELLQAAASLAQGHGHLVVRATGAEFEASLSFAGLQQLVYPLNELLERLSSAYQRAIRGAIGFVDDGATPDTLTVSSAAFALFREAARERTVVVIIDDLHWIDRASAVVLGFVARRLSGSGVALLGALRTDEETLFDRSGLRRLDLQPLDDAAASRLLSSRFPALAPRVRARLIREAEGNPLALLELPVPLTPAQRTSLAPLPSNLPLGRRLQSVFAARVQQLPAATRRLLLAAVLDGTGDLDALRDAYTRDLLKALAPAERAQLVHVSSGTSRLVFRHPLIKYAVVDRSTASERQEVHRLLAAQYLTDPERRAWHLAEAADAPDESVAALLQSVAHRNLRRGDAPGAVEQLLRAADLSPIGSARAIRLAEAAYLGATVNGDVRGVSALMTQVREIDPEHGGSLAGAVAGAYELLNGHGNVEAAHRLLVAAIEAFPDNTDAHNKTLQEALYNLTEICHFFGREDAWAPFHRALQRLGPRPPELLAIVGATVGDPVHAALPMLPRLDAAIASLPAELSPARVVRVGVASAYVDRLPSCRTALQHVVERGRDGAAITSAIQGLFLLSNDAFFTGRWDEADDLASQGLELSRSHGYEMLTGRGLYWQALISAARGQQDATRKLTVELMQWAEARKVGSLRNHAVHVKALEALGQGEFEDAFQYASSVSPAGVFPSHAPHALWLVLDLVEAAVYAGRHAEAQAHVIAAQRTGIAAISSRLELVVNGAGAMVAAPQEQADLFERALSVANAEQWPFDYARVQLAYGVRLRRTKLAARARRHLSLALDTLERLNAQPWIARASSELRATGLAVKVPDHGGVAGLTQQEREIASLAAQGLTNKQIGERLFLSPRTVGSHLYQVFPKLGISSRAALRDALEIRQKTQSFD